ncbi:rhamnulokinase [Cohnella sp. JJ-181]|uniref:rhamnulokinase n=1 Tax=Cohnella rhizoplanae TaxID=2974897 RepID=UPI00232A81FE|nr:rhamnulokinase family protein [Cohnella sp. JJ-181]
MGASSGRAYIGELTEARDGERTLRVAEMHRFENEAVYVGKHMHWDILRLLQEIKRGIRKTFQAGYAPSTLGIDTWGVDFGLIDGGGELLGNPYHYRDPQTEGLIEELSGRFGADALFAASGLQFMPFNTIYQLYAMSKAGSAKLGAAKTLLLTPDLLTYLLTGVPACEFTMATTTQLFDPRTRSWNGPLLRELGIPDSLFLEPVAPGTPIGRLSDEVLEELRIPSVEAVAVGSHDTASAIAAVPAGDEPFAYLVCGTWSLLGTELSEPVLAPETLSLSFSNEGGVGGTYQLLKNIMGLWILQECKREWDEAGEPVGYPELVGLAEAAGPLRSLIDPDDARFYGPSDMTAKIRAFCRETGQPEPRDKGEFVRCILESLALRYRQALGQAEQLTGRTFGGLHMVGGGIQNKLLCRLSAGAIGRPVWAGPAEASAIGNLLMQFVAQGAVADLADARRLVAASFPVETYEPADSEQWEKAYVRFLTLRDS